MIYRKLYDSNHANTVRYVATLASVARLPHSGPSLTGDGRQMAVKRLVALEISAGNTNQAVTMLKEYLSTFSSDMQAVGSFCGSRTANSLAAHTALRGSGTSWVSCTWKLASLPTPCFALRSLWC